MLNKYAGELIQKFSVTRQRKSFYDFASKHLYNPVYFGIPESLDSRRKCWTLGSGRWTLEADHGRWTMDAGLWKLGSGHQTMDTGRYTLDAGVWTLDTGHCC